MSLVRGETVLQNVDIGIHHPFALSMFPIEHDSTDGIAGHSKFDFFFFNYPCSAFDAKGQLCNEHG